MNVRGESTILRALGVTKYYSLNGRVQNYKQQSIDTDKKNNNNNNNN